MGLPMRLFQQGYILSLLFCLLAVPPAISATLQAGNKIPMPAIKGQTSTEAEQNAAPAAGTENTPQSHKARTGNKLDLIHSEKSFEIRKGLAELEKKLPELLPNKNIAQKYITRVFDLLAQTSATTRLDAESFLEKHMPELISHAYFSADTFSQMVQKAFSNDEEMQRCLELFSLTLPSENAEHRKILDPEHSYMVIDGVMSTNEHILALTEKILTRQGGDLVGKGLWKDRHTHIFLERISKVPLKNQLLFLKIIDANVKNWVDSALLDRDDFIKMLAKMNMDDIAFQEKFIEFFTAAKNIPSLKKINLFDRQWSASLMSSITSESKPEEKDFSLRLFTFLLPAFAHTGGVTGADFRKIWQHIAENLDSFIDPLQIAHNNLAMLSSSKWLSRDNFTFLLRDYGKKSAASQQTILKFLDNSYDELDNLAWLDPAELAPLLFEAPATPETELAKLKFIKSHPDLISEKKIYDRAAVDAIVNSIVSEKNERSALMADLLYSGFDTWARQGLIDKKSVKQLLAIDNAHPNAARLVDVVAHNFFTHAKLFNKGDMLSLAQMSFSPLPDVRDKSTEFFKKNYEELKKKDLLSINKIRSIFRKSGMWDEVSQRK